MTQPAERNTNMDVGPTEMILILLIVLLLIGGGRINKLGGELGSGIRAFPKDPPRRQSIIRFSS
jgi:TatA/E family protein of Tat protein translocase